MPTSGRPHNSRRWQRVRAIQLQREPLCNRCRAQGIVKVAEQVHHVQRITDGGAMFDLDNLMSLCAFHHGQETNREQGKRPNHGVDADGYPLDPDHTWNRTPVTRG